MASRDRHSGVVFEAIVGDVFRKAGWTVRRQVTVGDAQADLLADSGGLPFLVEVKSLSEGRRDRLIPLLAQAILQSKFAAEKYPCPAVPVAVVGANRIAISVAEEARRFAARHAPEVGAGVVDSDGLRVFTGHGLERFNASPTRQVAIAVTPRPTPSKLFSDLNQWMLKILIGQVLPRSSLRIPKGEIRNASQLAVAANVSTMSATRLVRRLTEEGFLDDRRDHLKLVRIEELLERWVAVNREAFAEVPARWIIERSTEQFHASLADYSCKNCDPSQRTGGTRNVIARTSIRCCLGLFAAADVLGLGFVRGVPPYLWMERLETGVLRRFGLTADDSPMRPDVYVRVPANREAVFRAATTIDGVPVSDVLQTWLDVSTHPARGRVQADVIRKRALGPLISETSEDGRSF